MYCCFLQDRAEKVLLVNKIVCGIIDAACLSNIMNGETENNVFTMQVTPTSVDFVLCKRQSEFAGHAWPFP